MKGCLAVLSTGKGNVLDVEVLSKVYYVCQRDATNSDAQAEEEWPLQYSRKLKAPATERE